MHICLGLGDTPSPLALAETWGVQRGCPPGAFSVPWSDVERGEVRPQPSFGGLGLWGQRGRSRWQRGSGPLWFLRCEMGTSATLSTQASVQ